MHRLHVVLGLLCALGLLAEAASHGGNYGRRTFRYRRPSWLDDPRGLERGFGVPGGYYGGGGRRGRLRGPGGSVGRFLGSGGRLPGSESSVGRLPGSGGSVGRLPDSGGSVGRLPGTSTTGDDAIHVDTFNDLGAPSGGSCPLIRPSCTTSRTRAQYCESDSCGPGRKCCFDACLQKDVCKTTV